MMPAESIICIILISIFLFGGLYYVIDGMIRHPKEWFPWLDKELWDSTSEDDEYDY